MTQLLLACLTAFWILLISLVSAQNGAAVRLQFLGLQSIQIPFGLVLAVSVAVGMVGMGLALPLWAANGRRGDREDFE